MPSEIEKPKTSPLLVFAVSGRIGSGCTFVRDKLFQSLTTYGYQVELIDVADVFLESWEEYVPSPKGANTTGEKNVDLNNAVDRVREFQRRGDLLRESYGNEIIAALCVSEVIERHISENRVLLEGKRQAYIIDSLKRPEEVLFLRAVFCECFYMVGVVASDSVRLRRLQQRKGFTETTFKELSERDAHEAGTEFGQEAITAVTKADYFFANDYAKKEDILGEANRLLQLIFGIGIQSPRREEVGMQVAFKAAARSACLSRQVGAAILTADGVILSTGHNDVPEFGGGLYGPDSKQEDKRCWTDSGKCHNDDEKRLIMVELIEAFEAEGLFGKDVGQLKKLAEKIIGNSRIKQLIEFSRAVHAEADAIVSVARIGGIGIVGSTLYCTTFPCHNCTKHIIDAGIYRVVYLEPYEKSLAKKLHSDAISLGGKPKEKDKVAFEIFGGVAPSRYDDFFVMKSSDERKKNGKFKERDRERTILIPIGAQESKVLAVRIEQIAAATRKIVRRSEPKVALVSPQPPTIATSPASAEAIEAIPVIPAADSPPAAQAENVNG